ncbi:MAG: element excision factor XisH family protein [Nodosilinea sp.]
MVSWQNLDCWRGLIVARDRFHQIVKTALIRDGWTVTHDPLQLKVGGVDMEKIM